MANGDPSGVMGKQVEQQLAIVRCVTLTKDVKYVRHRTKSFQLAEGYLFLVDDNEIRKRTYKKTIQEVSLWFFTTDLCSEPFLHHAPWRDPRKEEACVRGLSWGIQRLCSVRFRLGSFLFYGVQFPR